jgi:hypothetical protein
MDHSSSTLWIEGLALVIGLIINAVTVAYIAGRHTKALDLLVLRIDREAADHRAEQDNQWSKINSTAEEVRYLAGQQAAHGLANGRSKGASAGGHD